MSKKAKPNNSDGDTLPRRRQQEEEGEDKKKHISILTKSEISMTKKNMIKKPVTFLYIVYWSKANIFQVCTVYSIF